MEKTTLSRTVFIGLGGTGADAILRTKSLMLDNFGEVPPMIKFLAIDTDSITKVSYKNKAGETIMLNDDEFIHFRVPDVKNYVDANPKETSFFPKDMLKRKMSITDGAGQFRSCGRISLIANDNSSLRTQLANIIGSVKLWVAAHDDKYRIDTNAPTRVFVVFSIAGGTGAGLFVDFSLLIKGDKAIAAGTGIKTVAVGLLPDVYAGLGVLAYNCKPNAITGITEYEFIADGHLKEIIPDPDHPARNVSTAGGKYPVEHDNLYDTFFVLNNESSTGVKYESSKEMADLISMSLYLAAGATGGVADSALDNMTALKAGQELRGRVLRYLGLGCAEMLFDARQVAAYYSLMQANYICKNLLGSAHKNLNIDQEIQIRMDEWKIQEDKNRDDVIDFLAEPKPKQRFSGVHEFDESAATAMSSKKGEYISAVRKGLVASIHDDQGKLDQLLGRSLNNTQTFVTEKINTPGGLDYIKKVFPELIGRLRGMMDEMNAERKDFEEKHSRLENTFGIQLSDIRDAANVSRFNVFKSKAKAIQAACEEFVNTVNSEAGYIYEIERRTAAIAFYRKMINRSEDILNKVTGFEDRLRKVLENTAQQIQQIKSRNPKEPFTIHVTPEYISSMEFDPGDVDIDVFLQKVKLSGLVLQGEMEVNELFSRITGYTSALEKTKSYKETTILDILQKMPPERVRELFLKLKSSIGILRRLDTNYPIDNARNYVIGVFDVSHPAIIDKSKAKVDHAEGESDKTDDLVAFTGESGETGKKSKKIIQTPGDILRSEFKFDGKTPELSNTKDPNKIIVSSYESAVPAFLVKNFEGYAIDMEHKKVNIAEELRYSNKHWGDIIMRRNYSIFPQNEDNAIMAWALAFLVSKVEREKHGESAMQFIVKPKSGKYAVFTKSGDKAMKELNASRSKAYEMFKEQQLVYELLPLLQHKIKDDLSTYKSRLEELKNDHQGKLYIDEYSNHNLGKTTYKSEAHENTRTLIMDEFRFLKATADIKDLI